MSTDVGLLSTIPEHNGKNLAPVQFMSDDTKAPSIWRFPVKWVVGPFMSMLSLTRSRSFKF